MFTRFTAFLKPTIGKAVLAIGMLAAATAFAMPQPALADTRSTAEIVAAAALFGGAIAYDNGGLPYYVRSGRRWYVSPQVAGYYRDHYRFNDRRFNDRRFHGHGH